MSDIAPGEKALSEIVAGDIVDRDIAVFIR
jgi:hypothetical protein